MNCTLHEKLLEARNKVLQGAHRLITDLRLPLNEDTLKQMALLGLALGPCLERALKGTPTASDQALMTTLTGIGQGIAFIQQFLECDPVPAANLCAKGFIAEAPESKPRTQTTRKEAPLKVAANGAVSTKIVQQRSSIVLRAKQLPFYSRIACTFWDDTPVPAGVVVERLALSGWTPHSANTHQYVSTVLGSYKGLFSRTDRGLYVLTEVGKVKKAEAISFLGPNVVTPEGKPLVMPKKVPKGKLPKKIKTR